MFFSSRRAQLCSLCNLGHKENLPSHYRNHIFLQLTQALPGPHIYLLLVLLLPITLIHRKVTPEGHFLDLEVIIDLQLRGKYFLFFLYQLIHRCVYRVNYILYNFKDVSFLISLIRLWGKTANLTLGVICHVIDKFSMITFTQSS